MADDQTHRVTQLIAREIIDCRGLPTIQVDLELDGVAAGRADVPSGRSTGANEATELRDGGKRFGGYGVQEALQNITGPIRSALVDRSFEIQRELDEALISLDGTPKKEHLGGNAIVGVSLAAARAFAARAQVPVYRWLSTSADLLPVPQVNLINGGRHASNDLDFQEFIIMPVGAESFRHAITIATEVNLALAEILLKKYGKSALNTGDEGGFAAPIYRPDDALGHLHAAVAEAGYASLCVYGLDCAATQLYDKTSDRYLVGGHEMDRDQLLLMYQRFHSEYMVTSFEDPFHEEDWEGFAAMTDAIDAQIVGDDLFVTNKDRLTHGISRGAGNALLWKVNQIGTLTEALEAAECARNHGYRVIVSERSGETEDSLIADLAVGLNAGQIKTGAPVRGERTSKYNRLMTIEDELGSAAKYAGDGYLDLKASPV